MSSSHLQLVDDSNDALIRQGVEKTDEVPWGFLGLLAASAIAHRAMTVAAATFFNGGKLNTAEAHAVFGDT